MHLIAFIIHIIVAFLLGQACFDFFVKGEKSNTDVFLKILLGILLETSLGFWILWGGGNIREVAIAAVALSLALNFKRILSTFKNISGLGQNISSFFKFLNLKNLKWYEWLFVFLIIEKLVVVMWQLVRMPTYHSDAIKTWSTVGRSIYSEFNFNLTPKNPEFLAQKLQVVTDYPLQLPIWRATSAVLNGEWNDFVSRSDGLLFFIVVIGLVGFIFFEFSKRRWIGLGAAFIIASLPLHVWQAASGYADLGVEAYVLAAIITFIRKEWLLCGLFMAGAVWCKNDGLALYVPGILAAGFIYHVFDKNIKVVEKIKFMGQFVLGFAIIVPWLVFQGLYTNSVFKIIVEPLSKMLSYTEPINDYEVVLTQVGKFKDSPDSYYLFWDYVFSGSSHGIFWLAMVLGLIVTFKKLIQDKIGRSLLIWVVVTSIIIFYIFTYTPAYEYLLIQTTVHRTMLQFSAPIFVIFGYGLSLFLKDYPLNQSVAASTAKISLELRSKSKKEKKLKSKPLKNKDKNKK